MRKKYRRVLLVTKDKSLRLQAAAMNIDTEYYERDITPCYQGNEIITTKPEVTFLSDDQKIANRFFIVEGDAAGVWVLRRSGAEYSLERIEMPKQKRLGIGTRNIEQVAAAWALLNPEIKFVSLQGEAGCGKTFLSILAGISGILDKRYDKIIITRAMTAVDGEGLGALPGDASQKISPYMGGVYDNIAAIKRVAVPYLDKDKKKLKEFEDILAKQIEAVPFDLMRGRTLDRTFLIIDEAQNTTTHAMKMLLTRVSDNSKVAVMGDNKQIDDPYLDSRSNGMAKAIKTFKDFSEAAHITLTANERGSVSRHATKMK
jgi:PhoH-like ATPase